MGPDYGRPYGDEDELESLDREIKQLHQRRRELARAKLMDPKDERLAELSYEAGVSRANYSALRDKHRDLEKRYKERGEKISSLSDIAEERDDAIAERDKETERRQKLEAKIERSDRARKAAAKRKRKVAKK